ncbi:MAG: hypothetical protein ACK4GK_10925 [Ferrovibrio sp.]
MIMTVGMALSGMTVPGMIMPSLHSGLQDSRPLGLRNSGLHHAA